MSQERLELIRKELENCPPVRFVMPSDLIMLPDSVETVLRRAFRQGRVKLSELAEGMQLEFREAESVADTLIQKGFLHKQEGEGEAVYLARFGGRSNPPGGGLLDKL